MKNTNLRMIDKGRFLSFLFHPSSFILLWVLFAPFFYGCGGSEVDGPSVFEVTPAALTLSSEQKSAKFTINTDASWQITLPADAAWCKLSATGGEGSAEITVTADDNTTGLERKAILTVAGNGNTAQVTVSQIVSNTPPTAPQLNEPASNATDVAVLPVFKWVISIDAENEPITYTVSFSKDQKTWTTSDPIEKNEYACKNVLKIETTYYWKVTAQDKQGGKTESAIGSFKTGSVDAYQDGELFQRITHTKGKRGVRLVFTGDGFMPQDFIKGAEFDKAVEEACTALFAVEPYKTYKEYFDVFQVAAYSEERGISDERTGSTVSKKTCFNTRLSDQGASMLIGSGNSGAAKVFSWIKTAMSLTDFDMPETVITIISNEDAYGGCCYMTPDQTSVAVCARSTKLFDPSASLYGHFKNLLAHELGHAIGMLAEEYVNDGYEDKTITGTEITSVRKFQTAEGYQNISLSATDIPWKEFIGVEGYEEVKVFEGGNGFGKGVWRPENTSCMNDNRLRYSAPARRAIVNRIMRLAGEPIPTFEQFVANDNDTELPPE